MFENIKSGVLREIFYDDEKNLNYIVIKDEKNKKTYNIEKEKIPYMLHDDLYIGKIINYIEMENKEISLKEVMEIKRTETIEKIKNNEITNAKITKIIDRGAYLSIYGVNGLIRNCDFSSDYSAIGDVYKEGDIIEDIEFRKISKNGRVCVKSKVKYESDCTIEYNDLKRGNLVVGIVKEVINESCFVGVIKGVDMLCNSKDLDKSDVEGCRVVCKIKKVDIDKGILRGSIINIL